MDNGDIYLLRREYTGAGMAMLKCISAILWHSVKHNTVNSLLFKSKW